MRAPLRFYSEYGEDRWIFENLNHLLPERGVYLDLGCGHPENGSNTAFLRDNGWVGLAVDGHEPYAPHWVGRQQFVHAILTNDPKAAFVRFHEQPDNSSLCRIVPDTEANKGVKKKRAVNLENLLAGTFGQASPKIQRLDFMSLDLEGAEFDVFNTFAWVEWEPQIIVAEYATLDTSVAGHRREDFRLQDLLVGSGRYQVVHRTTANLIYRRI